MFKPKIKIFADGASFEDFKNLNKKKFVSGFTTNPTLMKKNGIKNYEVFAKNLLKFIKKKPISFEVFADEIDLMYEQAIKIASWGENVNIKIPIVNTKGQSTKTLIHQLSKENITCNVTAIFTINQIKNLMNNFPKNKPIILSFFAGRVADTLVNPSKVVTDIVKFSKSWKNCQILWASTREIYNIVDSTKSGCHIITVPIDMINKIEKYYKKNLNQFSIETVKMFYKDAKVAGYKINK